MGGSIVERLQGPIAAGAIMIGGLSAVNGLRSHDAWITPPAPVISSDAAGPPEPMAYYLPSEERSPVQPPEAYAGSKFAVMVTNYDSSLTVVPGAATRIGGLFERMAANQFPDKPSAQIKVDGALVPIYLRLKAQYATTAIVILPKDIGADSLASVQPIRGVETHVISIPVPTPDDPSWGKTIAHDASAMLTSRAFVRIIFDAAMDVKTMDIKHTKNARRVMGDTLALAIASRSVYGASPEGFARYRRELAAADTPVPGSDTIVGLNEAFYSHPHLSPEGSLIEKAL